MTTRVRFAPSPTGYLHIGGVRTALYCWLWARKNNGKFVLRIEDTDADRSTDESVETVVDSLRWLGLDWDEGPDVGGDYGPYRQSDRLEIYRSYAEKLIKSGHAFRCYATKEEIQNQREAYLSAGKKGFKFRSAWRDRTDGDPSKPHSIRFKAPTEGETGWRDVVRGDISFPNIEQQDFILLRPNGLPLYNFACVVDDFEMKIDLVARGDDHLINTPNQILIYQALGAKIPRFAHLPMVLGPDGKKLSKRHAAVGVLEYRDLGYLPEGVMNYLARLGWSHGDQEYFTPDELKTLFDWDHVGVSASKYDSKKFEDVQGHHLREADDKRLASLVIPFLKKRGIEVDADDPRLAAIAPVKLRCATLEDLAEGLDYFLRDEPVFEEKAKNKFLKNELAPHLRKLLEIVQTHDFEKEPLEAAVKAWIEKDGIKMRNVAQPARAALTGRSRSPGLYETMILLGKPTVETRLKKGIEIAEST